MIFRRISYRIALLFTGFVFLLFLINGVAFLFADFGNARRETVQRLSRMLQYVAVPTPSGMVIPPELPPMVRQRVRVIDDRNRVLHSGALFEEVPFRAVEGLSEVRVQGEDYNILTVAMLRDDLPAGYVQVAEVQRVRRGDIPMRAVIYLAVSIIVSGLTFLAGLFFARRSLRPAEEMVVRLEQFTQDASHELRTPLATLNSSLDLALRSRKYREGIESAKEDVSQISGLVERLLELTRLDALTLETEVIDLSALAAQTVEKFTALATEKGIAVTADVTPGIRVRGDASLLRQLLNNLLSNALKFTKNGGGIRVRLRKGALAVEDDGVGIPAQAVPHLFERFYQVDASRSKGGFGLGLALVKRIVDLHGWAVDVRSAEGAGTTFTVRFRAEA